MVDSLLKGNLAQRFIHKSIGQQEKVIFDLLALPRLLCGIVLLSPISTSYAGPVGGNIVGGAGSINQTGFTTHIHQLTNSLAIDWASFNVNQNEIVNFLQPGSNAITLNRILGGSASQIHGQINANGHVVLVNPNGIFFGATSSINVGGLIASGLDIDPIDFMNGDYVFKSVDGTTGAVINGGVLNASLGGSITLLGKQVRNDGLISANLGTVNLAAGNEAVLTFDTEGLLGVKITKAILQDELGVDPAILNSGDINTEGGRVLLTASQSQDIFSSAVNSGDVEQATSVVVHDDGSFTLGGGANLVNTGSVNVSATGNNQDAGKVVLLAENIINSGLLKADSLDANGGEIELHSTDTTSLIDNSTTSARSEKNGVGGEIKILGNKVGLFDQSVVDASGAEGGGIVLVGGDRQGLNKGVRNAEFVYLGENTEVKVDALHEGHGGKLITFATDTARIYGGLYARGGLLSGNGGFVETSGLKGFEILKTPDISAINGVHGEWLIDPNNIDIVSGGGNTNINTTSPFVTSNDSASLGVNLIEAALSGGATVTITTGTAGANLEPGDITLDANLNYDDTGNSTLNLNASNNIIINQDIKDNSTVSADSLNLNLFAGNSVSISDSDIDTNGGNFSVTAVNFNAVGTGQNTIDTSGGDVTLIMSGFIDLETEINTEGGEFSSVSTSFINTNSGINGAISTTGGTGTGNIFITTTSGAVTLGAITTNNNAVNNGALTITSGGAVTQASELVINGSTQINASGQTVTLLDNDNDFTQLSVSADVADIKDTNSIVIGSSTITGTATSFRVTADDISQVGGSSIINNGVGAITNFDASVDSITVNEAGNDFNQFTATAADSVTVRDVNSIVFGDLSISGSGATTLSVTAGGNVTQLAVGAGINNNGANAITDITATNGFVSLTNAANDFDQVNINAVTASIQDTDDIRLGDISLSGLNSTSLRVVALNGGDITQVSGTTISNNGVNAITNLAADGDSINLDGATNDFNQLILLADNATIVDANAIELHALTLTGNGGPNLSITANGNITQGVATNINNSAAGAVSLFDAATNDITLDNNTNDFFAIGLNAATASVTDMNAISLADSVITGTNETTLNVSATGAVTQVAGTSVVNNGVGAITNVDALGQNITLSNTNNDFTTVAVVNGVNVDLEDVNSIDIGASSIAGTLDIVANNNGDITQSGALSVIGVATLTADGNDIVFDNVSNQFSNVVVNNARNVELVDVDSIILGAATLAGTLDVTALSAGNITQNGILNVNGASVFTASGDNITLGNTSNDFSTISVNGADVNIQDAGNVDLGASVVTGVLNVTANGAGGITQSGAVAVTGVTTLNAIGNDITLADSDNNFSTVIVNGADVTLQDVDSIILGASVVTGALDVTTNGSTPNGFIAQSGALLVTGLTTMTAVGNNISLTDASNDFSTISTNAANVILRDVNNIDLGVSNVTDTYSIIAINAADITQSGGLSIGGDALFILAAGQDIQLADTSNNFQQAVSFFALGGTKLNNVSVANSGVLNLNDINVANNLVVSASGITNSGVIVVDNTAWFEAGSNSIVLDNPLNDFNNVVFNNASSVSITDVDDINIGATAIAPATFSNNTNISGDFTVTTLLNLVTDDITNTGNGSLTVGGVTAFNAGAGSGDVIMDSASNDFSVVDIVNAQDVTLSDINSIDLLSTSINGDLLVTVIAGGDILNSTGALRVTGSSSFVGFDGGSVSLSDVNNQLSGVVNISSTGTLSDALITNSITTEIGNVTAQNLTVASIGITDSATSQITVTNSTNLNGGNQDIVLDGSNHQFIDLTVSNTKDLTLANVSGLAINDVSVTGNAVITAGGDVQLGSLNAGNTANVTTSAAIIDNNGDTVNVTANNVVLHAASGIGSDDAIETATASLDVVNTVNNDVDIVNTGVVELVALKNTGVSGDITIVNDLDYNINPGSIVANRDNGDLLMTTQAGSFLGLGNEDITNPDITAQNATFFGRAGTFGTFDRPITLNVPGAVLIDTRASFDPQFVPPRPNSISTLGLDFAGVLGALSSLGGEQLVEVESLGEIDQAIFTDLQNYSMQEISIRMPRDQLFEDELEGYDRL